MNGPCTTIRQYRDRDQDRQNRKDAELEAARREADSFSFGPRHKLTNTRLEIAMSLDVYLTEDRPSEIYEANITHNLNKMADAAGIYKHLWRPEEIAITKAGELIAPLTAGLKRLREDPEHFKQFNSINGWGRYENFVLFVEGYLAACIENPKALVSVSR